MRAGVSQGINFRKVGNTKTGITLDERTRPETVESVWRAFGIERKDSDFDPNYRILRALLEKQNT